MWMGAASAWAAAAMAMLFAASAFFQFATGVPSWAYVATALLLAAGSFRTLRKMSGGLRLLGGAWGFAAGLLVLPLTSQAEGAAFDTGGAVMAVIALIGLALTVLHKEK
jgi:hypothetical protein